MSLIYRAAWAVLVYGILTGSAMADWKDEANERIERLRKGDFTLRIEWSDGSPAADTQIQLRQVRSHFHFGTCLALRDPDDPDEQRYRQFILDHFNTIVAENAMKWYAIERDRGQRSFDNADRHIAFAEQHNLAMRGHTIHWAVPRFVQPWLQKLNEPELREAVERHMDETVRHFRGRLIAWDVNNEMLDGSFYADRLGPEIRPWLFRRAHELDPHTPLFVNEYGILDNDAKTERYIELIQHLQQQGAPIGGIGIQEHFAQRLAAPTDAGDDARPELPPQQVLARLDRLAQLNLPIHLTEISVRSADRQRQADALEAILRIGFSHPQVEAILLWGFWENRHWLGPDAGIVAADWRPHPAAQRLRHLLLEEWRTSLEAQTDNTAAITFRGFHGTYEITATSPDGQPMHATIDLPPEQDETPRQVILQP